MGNDPEIKDDQNFFSSWNLDLNEALCSPIAASNSIFDRPCIPEQDMSKGFTPFRLHFLDSKLFCHPRQHEDSRPMSRNELTKEKKACPKDDNDSPRLPLPPLDFSKVPRLDSLRSRVSLATSSVNRALERFWVEPTRKSRTKQNPTGVIDSSSTASTDKTLSDDDTLVQDVSMLSNFAAWLAFI